jgi:hypothetical protein
MGKSISEQEFTELLSILGKRFKEHKNRHAQIVWEDVVDKLRRQPDKVWSLNEMERTGGEPDVVGYDPTTDSFLFYDCAVESPKGRRSVCYDESALQDRKEHKPHHSAVGMAREMGIGLLDETDYRKLQQLGEFDLKTSSWILTPEPIRLLGGALFCDRRYDHVFVYHNGASSYYGARGFRGKLTV